METQHYYEVQLNWEKERIGIVSSPVLNENIEVATPPDFPHGIPGIWSPEHLLIAAVNSCLMTTFLAVAENSNLPFLHFESNAIGKLEKIEGRYMISEVELKPVVTVADASFREKTVRVLEKSEAACLVSNSIKAKIILKPEVRW